jgi:hypothetical protein
MERNLFCILSVSPLIGQLLTGQPNHILFQTDINPSLAVFSLIYNNPLARKTKEKTLKISISKCANVQKLILRLNGDGMEWMARE